MAAIEALGAQAPQHIARKAKPGGGLVVTGDAVVARHRAEVVVRQSSEMAVIAFDELSLEADAVLRLEQPSVAALTVLVVQGGSASTLAGRLEAPGRVVLSNPHGVVFAPSAQVVVAGLVAAAHELARDPEKACPALDAGWERAFGKDHAQSKSLEQDADQTNNHPALMACDGRLRFEGGAASAAVENAGAIRAAEAGFVALVGPQVRQSGTIVAPLGRVGLAACAGCAVTPEAAELIGFAAGDKLAAVACDGSAGLVVQTGRIAAAGGTVALTAHAAEAVANASIEVSGVVQASSVSRSGGVIRLEGPGEVRIAEGGRVEATGALGGGHIAVDAGRFVNAGLVAAEGVDGAGRAVAQGGRIAIVADHVALGGTMSVSGASGGRLVVTSSGLLSLGEAVEAKGLAGAGGLVQYRAERVVETAGSETDASGSTDGGVVSVVAQTDLMSSGTYLAAGGFGSGGRIDLTAADVRLLSARLAASGARQGGLVRVGGAFQGGKAGDASQPAHAAFVGRWGKLPGLTAAESSFVNDDTVIDVSSAAGVGGTAVIWSDAQTTFLGGIAATGRTGGGAVEISSADMLRQAELLNVEVGNGQLLLDPKNITVEAGTGGWVKRSILGKGHATDFNDPNHDVSQKLKSENQFGWSVALNADGTRLAVGAPWDAGQDGAAANAGAVYLFSLNAANFVGAKLIAIIGKGYKGGDNVDVTELHAGDFFGWSVALNAAGTRLAVGADYDGGQDTSAHQAGAVYLFSFKNGDFGGAALAGIIGKGYKGGGNVDVPTLRAGDRLGWSVALSADGTRLAVGAPYDGGESSSAQNAGAVHLFTFKNGDFGGGQPAGVIGKGYKGNKDTDVKYLEPSFNLGSSVALSKDGTRLAVGAWGAGGGGAVFLFTFAAPDFRSPQLAARIGKGLTGPGTVDVGEQHGRFGASVALNAAGRLLAVGARSDAGHGQSSPNAGAVCVFTFEDHDFGGGKLTSIIGKGYTEANNVNVPELQGQDHFGAVALSADGMRRVVGASGNAGAVYLFTVGEENPSKTFGDEHSYDSITVKAADIAAALARGTAVILQAQNDITVDAAIDPMGDSLFASELSNDLAVDAAIETMGGSSSVGDLTLQAGRSVKVNADIVTGGGKVTLIANEHAAAGAVTRDAGPAVIALAAGKTIDVGSGAVELLQRESESSTGNADVGDIALAGAVKGGTIQVISKAVTPGKQRVVLEQGASLTASGTGDALVVSGHLFVNQAGTNALSAGNGRWLVWSTDPKRDERGGLSPAFKQYDAKYGATSPAQAAGNGLLYSVATPKITVGLTGEVKKTYDGNADATLQDSNYTVSGAIDGDTVTVGPKAGQYDSKAAATGKKVTVSGLSLTGATNGKAKVYGYQLAEKELSANIGTIDPAPLQVSGIHADDKPYDGTDKATVSGGTLSASGKMLAALSQDHVTLVTTHATGKFATKDVGTHAVTASGYTLSGQGGVEKNYDLRPPTTTASITKKVLTAKLEGTAHRVYDGTTTAPVDHLICKLDGIVANEKVTAKLGQATYVDKNFGSGKTVTVMVSELELAGAPATNYALQKMTVQAAVGVIDKAPLTLAGQFKAQNRAYDGTQVAQVDTRGLTLSGVVPSDHDIAWDLSKATGEFASKDVGPQTVRLIAPATPLTGTDATNYKLPTQLPTTTATITPKELTLAGQFKAQNRAYDGTQVAQVDTSGLTLSGVAPSDSDIAWDLSKATGEFASKDVGPQTVRLIAPATPLTGTGAKNYKLPTQLPTTTATITPKELTLAGQFRAQDREYDGTKVAQVDTRGLTLSGVVSSDHAGVVSPDEVALDLSKATGEFVSKDVGKQTVQLIPAATPLTGTDAKNYKLPSQLPTTKATITPKLLTVTVDLAHRRAGQPNPPFHYTISGFVPGEDETKAKVTGIKVTTTADAHSHHGDYPIKASGGSAPNYTFKYVDGILTIGR